MPGWPALYGASESARTWVPARGRHGPVNGARVASVGSCKAASSNQHVSTRLEAVPPLPSWRLLSTIDKPGLPVRLACTWMFVMPALYWADMQTASEVSR